MLIYNIFKYYYLSGFRWWKNYNHLKKKYPTVKLEYNAWCIESVLGEYVTLYNNVHVYKSIIGSYTYLAQDTWVSNSNIGKFCSIGPGVRMGTGEHPAKNFVSTHPAFFSTQRQAQKTFANKLYFEELRPIKIGNDVWIGANVFIRDGIFIGDGAIIAAGSVVVKDVPPYAVIGGVPGKILKYRFEKNEIEFLLKDQWWNKSVKWLAENFLEMHNIKDYMEKVQVNEDFFE